VSSAPATSRRLAKALAAEAAALARERARLDARRQALRDELAEVEAGLGALDERLALLARLGPSPADAPALAVAPPRAEPAGTSLRGAAVRETAVRLLAHRPEGQAPIHHRAWFALLEAAGYRVEGKDPLAVFLTQVTRSPLVVRAGAPGAYVLDRDAVGRLRRRLAAQHGQLRALVGARTERDALLTAIAQTERALDEAVRSLRPLGEADARLAG